MLFFTRIQGLFMYYKRDRTVLIKFTITTNRQHAGERQ